MKWFIPLFVALLFVGVGCLTQPSFDDKNIVAITKMPVDGLTGVLMEPGGGEFDVLILKRIDGIEEEILKPSVVSVLERGSMIRVTGSRDLATQQINATAIEVLNVPPVVVVSPGADATVTSPLLVSGFLRAERGGFVWRVRGMDGTVVFAAESTTEVATGYVPFQFEAFLPVLTDPAFTLEVEPIGDSTGLVSVPLKLLSTDTTTFDLYFPNGRMGSNRDCGLVFPVARSIAETSAIGRASLWQLLLGPTDAERSEGYSSSIPSFATVRSLVISDGVARVDFSKAVESGGSCRMESIRVQLEKTLRQFETVREIVITTEGEENAALQP